MASLYEIAQEYRHITDVLEDSGCDEQTLSDTLEGARWDLEVKAECIAYVRGNLLAVIDAMDAAQARQAKRKESMLKRVAAIEEYLKTGMEIAKRSELDCPHFTIKIKKNPHKVEVFNEALLPAKFMRMPVPKPVVAMPDKDAIKTALKANEAVPGAILVQETRLEIK